MANLKVRVSPGAREDAIAGWQDDLLRLRVRAAPEKGRANEDACRLIAQVLGVPPSAVRVVRGHASRVKVLAVEGVTEEEMMRRLRALVR